MAIGYLNVAIIGRSSGRSAVAAAAYASRTDLIDERTGTAYRYARKSGDLVSSFIWLPKGAPEHLRDRATLWNEVEKSETRKNSQTARRIILALPHELTTKQQQQLLQDFLKENFTRKGLAVDASIHEPDPDGDERNHHAHLLIPMRFLDKNGFGNKDRVSNDRATVLEAWQDSWTKLANRQLERYGHAARISFEVAEGQTPQNHMGPEATALERQGVETRAGDDLLQIVNDNIEGRGVANDQKRTIEKEVEPEVKQPQAWQDSIDSAASAYVEEQRRVFLQTQAAERATFDRHGEEMTARHTTTWGEVIERQHAEAVALYASADSSYQPGTMEEAGEAVSGGASFLLGLFASWAESITRSVSGSGRAIGKRQRSPERAKPDRAQQQQAEQQKETQAREMEAVLQEHARERESYERRRREMLFQQAGALQNFEQQVSEKSSLREAFELHTEISDSFRTEAARLAESRAAREGRERDGPELGS